MPDQPPNVLFILTDQQRRDTMRCYGNEWIQTPHLDRLADSSFVFENAVRDAAGLYSRPWARS